MTCKLCGREIAYVGASCSYCAHPPIPSFEVPKPEPMNWSVILERYRAAVAEFERLWK